MGMKNYDDLNSLEMDTLKEVGSIGTGNAATSLSSLIGKPVRIMQPEVRIMEYNEAIERLGGPEEITAGVMVGMSGQMSGILLAVQQLEFVKLVLKSMMDADVKGYEQLGEMERSALTEVGNIMISTFINALSGLAGIEIDLTVPGFTIDMQGAIVTVPMAAYGGQSNYIMTIGGDFVCDGKNIPCRLLLSPDIRSLNFLLRKLGVNSGE